MSNNYVAVYQGLKQTFCGAMLEFITDQLATAFGGACSGDSIVACPVAEAHEALDVTQFIPIVERHWTINLWC